MSSLEFVDPHGVHWRVWSTVPGPSSPLAPYYPGGWLTFDSGGATLRRFSPVPNGWEAWSPQRLDLARRAAVEVPRHTGEMVRMARPTEGPLADAPPTDATLRLPTSAAPPPAGPDQPQRR